MGEASRAPRSFRDPARLAALAAALLCAGIATAGDAAGSRAEPKLASLLFPRGGQIGVVVQERSPGSPLAERLVRRLGGKVTWQLPIVEGFAAELPAAALPAFERSGLVVEVWRDGLVSMSGDEPDDEPDDDEPDDEPDDDDDLVDIGGYDVLPPNRLWRDAVGLTAVEDLYDGADVAVAVVDTGVSPAADLSETVEARVELTPGRDGVDRFGHGTHMAGIIAGDGSASRGAWQGVAPDADLISLKVAGPDGATDVSVVIAALQWIVTNRNRFGIRVLNLSFGTDAVRPYLTDPLNYAVERVWRAGILVVVAAGNRGPDPASISKPADDPFALTVGAVDLRGTVSRLDDVVAPFSSRGPTADNVAKPDVVAPGISIVSVRARGSWADIDRPEARVGNAYFKGTGTSQAAAIVSGIAALLFEADPSLTPDEAKAALAGTSSGLRGQAGAGNGLVDANRALRAVRAGTYGDAEDNAPSAPASGIGLIEPSRGSYHVYGDPDGDGVPEQISGEIDALGNAWNAGTSWGMPWPTSPWSPLVGEFEEWDLLPWAGPTWSGMVLDASAWSAKHWSSSGWVAKHWSARHWSASVWN